MKNINFNIIKSLSWKVLFMTILMTSCVDEKNVYVVKEQKINKSIYASGEIFPSEYLFLMTNSPKQILNILVNEGEFVKKRTPLVVLGDLEASEESTIVKNQIQIAQKNMSNNSIILKELKSKIDLAKKQNELDSQKVERYKKLVLTQAVSKEKVEEVVLQAHKSHTELLNLQQQYKIKEDELLNALLNYQKQYLSSSQILRSTIDGIIYTIDKKNGEACKDGEPILMVGSDKYFKLELLIDERDISKISEGQIVYFKTDTYPNQQFQGVVTHINPVLQKKTGCFKIDAKIDTTYTCMFYPQSSVEANIVIEQNVNTLMIPSAFLLKEDSLKIKKGDIVNKIKIERGVIVEDWIEITNGINIGDEIVK